LETRERDDESAATKHDEEEETWDGKYKDRNWQGNQRKRLAVKQKQKKCPNLVFFSSSVFVFTAS